MNIAKLNTFTLLSLFILSGFSMNTLAAYKCWKNHEGITECGEKIPPEFAQKGHREISGQGMVIDKQERARTESELKAAEKQARLDKEKKERAAEKSRQDKILMDSYTKISEIEKARDDKIAVIRSSIALSEKRNVKLTEELAKHRASAEKEELAGRAPGDDLIADIESLKRQLKNNQQFMKDKDKEIQTLKDRYAADIARFEELRAGGLAGRGE